MTADAMAELYQQGTQEADAMFKQSADKFATMVASMKQMAAEMHHELEATRNELRRGVLEMPQEAAESTAQMRKVIVDQIEALAELNRIVAHHGRGLDVVSSTGPRQRRSARKSRCWRPPAAATTLRARAAAADARQRLEPAAAGPRHARLAPHRSAAGQPRQFRPGPRRLAVRPAEPHRCRPATRDAPRGRPPQPRRAAAIRWNRCRSTSAG